MRRADAKAVSILEGIQTFERLRKSNQENIDGIFAPFPSLITKAVCQDEIYYKCIARLNERLTRQLEIIECGSFSEDENNQKYQLPFHEQVIAGLNSF